MVYLYKQTLRTVRSDNIDNHLKEARIAFLEMIDENPNNRDSQIIFLKDINCNNPYACSNLRQKLLKMQLTEFFLSNMNLELFQQEK
jgi:hypothetical protein